MVRDFGFMVVARSPWWRRGAEVWGGKGWVHGMGK